MTDDQLPALPEPDVAALSDFFIEDGSRQSLAFSHDALRAYGLECYEAGRASRDAEVEALRAERDELRRALEAIAVGDAQIGAQFQAAQELIALGYWHDISEPLAARGDTPQPADTKDSTK